MTFRDKSRTALHSQARDGLLALSLHPKHARASASCALCVDLHDFRITPYDDDGDPTCRVTKPRRLHKGTTLCGVCVRSIRYEDLDLVFAIPLHPVPKLRQRTEETKRKKVSRRFLSGCLTCSACARPEKWNGAHQHPQRAGPGQPHGFHEPLPI